MKKEKLILAAVSLFLVIISLVGVSVAIGAVQNETSVEKNAKESVREKEDEITKKTFQVFISGLDTYGEKDRSKRSDLNLLVTVNPSEKRLLITGIPRDLYVSFPSESTNEEKQKTKFSHLSLYGTKSLVQGAEELLDTKIDYYIQLNMSGFRKLIDAIGGVDVEADRSFETDWKTSFQKGINHVNGKEALTFVRERHHHLKGVEQRNKNHQEMLKAILKQVMKKNLMEMDINALYKLCKKNVRTDMKAGEILSLMRWQKEEKVEWEMETATIKGKFALETLAEYHDAKLYVEKVDQRSLDQVSKKIKKLLNS